MSVLKIKDQNGNWIQIPTIKGEDGQDYVLTENDKQEIASLVDAPVEDVQVRGTSIVTNGTANVPIANGQQVLGLTQYNSTYGITVNADGRVQTFPAISSEIKGGTNDRRPITPSVQHESAFYGLAKASGDTTQAQSNNAVGTYTDEAKASIQSMLGIANKADKLIVIIGEEIDSTNNIYQIDSTYLTINNALTNGASVVIDNYPEIFPYVGMAVIDNNPVLAFGTSTTFNGTAVLSGYLIMQNNTAMRVDQFTVIPTSTSQLVNDSLIEDVVINGNSVVTDGIASIPVATANDLGVIKIGSDYGIGKNSDNRACIQKATDTQIKNSSGTYRPITPDNQHNAVFYGLAKAAGDTTQSSSSNTVGTYTDEAKTAIKQMLDVKDDYDSLVVEVSGTDPVITGKPSYRYNCGELYTLTVTPPASGTMDIIFTSGTTPTVLSLPNTVKMPDWWAGIETNTTYEMCITDGTYCGVMSWAT